MRSRFEFQLYRVPESSAAIGEADPTLALLGSQGWEIRGICPGPAGELVIALQRPEDEVMPLPDAPTLTAALAEPLVAPSPEENR